MSNDVDLSMTGRRVSMLDPDQQMRLEVLGRVVGTTTLGRQWQRSTDELLTLSAFVLTGVVPGHLFPNGIPAVCVDDEVRS